MSRRPGTPPGVQPDPGSVYAWLGPGACAALCTDFSDRVLSDPRLYPWLREVGPAAVARLRAFHAGYLTAMLGGPRYRGRDLAEAHARVTVSTDAFMITVGHLRGALQFADVDDASIERVIGQALALRPLVVRPGHPAR